MTREGCFLFFEGGIFLHVLSLAHRGDFGLLIGFPVSLLWSRWAGVDVWQHQDGDRHEGRADGRHQEEACPKDLESDLPSFLYIVVFVVVLVCALPVPVRY